MTEDELKAKLKAVPQVHVLTTSSRRGSGFTEHRAGCSCGETYEWYDRENVHRMHLDDERVKVAEARVAEATADLRDQLVGARSESDRLREQLAVLRQPIRDSAQTLYRLEVRRQLGTFDECDVDQLRDVQQRLAEIANGLASEVTETSPEPTSELCDRCEALPVWDVKPWDSMGMCEPCHLQWSHEYMFESVTPVVGTGDQEPDIDLGENARLRARLAELSDLVRLLGPARMVLDRCAERGAGFEAEAAGMAQRIVDLIGHPVTDEP